ncbi:hypothetical protein DH2020_036791 [Rehmannia glutinosa]|uniref:Uncharacterized protein n=1 Tax=Rehmannia glutinosa TaxID=99300 RepID=A0ABR0V3X9_REHGL
MLQNDFHQKSFRIKHEDDKFFTRLLSKESSKSTPSFRVYYGDVSSGVPFTWETRPGTPKHTSSENFHIPPLTPPPSYYTNNFNNSSKKHSRSKLLLHSLLRRMSISKRSQYVASSHSSSSSLSSLSWSSSVHSSFSDPIATPNYVHKRRRFSSWGSSFDAKSVDDHIHRDEVCPSRLCFGIGKKALLSIVGRGSA